jgi:hypothetical protein
LCCTSWEGISFGWEGIIDGSLGEWGLRKHLLRPPQKIISTYWGEKSQRVIITGGDFIAKSGAILPGKNRQTAVVFFLNKKNPTAVSLKFVMTKHQITIILNRGRMAYEK